MKNKNCFFAQPHSASLEEDQAHSAPIDEAVTDLAPRKPRKRKPRKRKARRRPTPKPAPRPGRTVTRRPSVTDQAAVTEPGTKGEA